ncbi:Holliday junction branch migration protein RuvA [Treponema sp. J25]|uniref:Holliday junction branch migration protein RuvA n=1 Tax=Treponema sp. J25 TaxID=2094121 RepID=UPI0010455CAF|nr:Holliday junction branch migration protein RuvA [Treponema sp. J25]TCW61391.1 Holliday junction branch migration protein RuvA [Treponema sp. J25]
MFNSLRGILTARMGETVYLATGGIEWDITVPLLDSEQLPPVGSEVRLVVWLYHREDQMKLFGFTTEKRRETFLELIKVEGVGPRQAIKILSGISDEDLEAALEKEDVLRLQEVPGLGKKTAQKLILSLKGKLVGTPQKEGLPPLHEDLVVALTNMGYDRRAAQEAVLQANRELQDGAPLAQEEREKRLFKRAILILSGE